MGGSAAGADGGKLSCNDAPLASKRQCDLLCSCVCDQPAVSAVCWVCKHSLDQESQPQIEPRGVEIMEACRRGSLCAVCLSPVRPSKTDSAPNQTHDQFAFPNSPTVLSTCTPHHPPALAICHHTQCQSTLHQI